MNDPAAIAQISTLIYQALAVAHQTQPNFLSEPYRQKNWSSDRNRSLVLEKLTVDLGKAADPLALLQRVQQIVQKLTTPEYTASSEYGKLKQSVWAILSEPAVHQEPSEPIAALLMDVENLQLTAEEELAIGGLCQYPLHNKIAFGNWKNLNGHDAKLYKRGYQLIHVPASKNAADLQMTAIGASLFLHYPNLREVIICSSDEHLIPLRNTLQARGLVVHRVTRKGTTLTMTRRTGEQVKLATTSKTNSAANQKTAQAATTSQEKNAIAAAQLIDVQEKLVILLQELTPQAVNGYLPINILAYRFRAVHGQPITDVLKELELPSKFPKFLEMCSKFKLQRVNNDWRVALT